MRGLWKVAVYGVVAAVHAYVLYRVAAPTTQIVTKPKVQIHKITMSKVAVVKPPKPAPVIIPKPAPVILPPEPEPVKPKPKPKPKKVVKKPVKKPDPKPEPIEEIVKEEVIVEEILETPVAPVAVVDTSSIEDAYKNRIRMAIKQKLYYPKMAKRLRMEDIVETSFHISKSGKISNIQILNAPKKLLADGAIKTLKSLDDFPIPDALNVNDMDITIPIEFRLTKE